MSAGPYNLLIEQGANFSLSVTWTNSKEEPINLTGYTAKAQVRINYTSAEPMLSFSIKLGGKAGTITLTASAAETEKVSRSGVWDLELTDGSGTVTRLLEGKAKLAPEVTR